MNIKYLIILPLACLIFFGYLCYTGYINSEYYFRRTLQPDCDYVLPKQYFLVRNDVSGQYAIKFMHLDTYEYYLEATFYSTTSPFIDDMGMVKYAMTFKDSCQAKGFCKYLKQQQADKDRVNSFH